MFWLAEPLNGTSMAAACPLSGPIMTPRVPPPLSQVAAGEWFAAQVWAGREHLCARHLLVRVVRMAKHAPREWLLGCSFLSRLNEEAVKELCRSM